MEKQNLITYFDLNEKEKDSFTDYCLSNNKDEFICGNFVFYRDGWEIKIKGKNKDEVTIIEIHL